MILISDKALLRLSIYILSTIEYLKIRFLILPKLLEIIILFLILIIKWLRLKTIEKIAKKWLSI